MFKIDCIVCIRGFIQCASAGGSTTANFMRDLIKALPAMHDLAGQAGIELPQILGKVGKEDNKTNETTEEV